MRKNDLNTILVEKVKATGGFFRPAEYRLALYLAAPPREDLERFVRLSVHHAMERAHAHISMLTAGQETTTLGEASSPLRAGLFRIISVSGVLSGEAKPDPSQQKIRDVVLDLAEDEINSLETWFQELRQASNRRLERMPDRLQKYRGLAEQALNRFLVEGDLDQDDWLREARSHVEDVLEQPVGQRDPYTWMLYAWIALRRDQRETAQHAFLQACLASSGERDALFFEANRCLALMQFESGAFESAFQTLQKGGLSPTDPTLLLDLLTAAIAADRLDDTVALVHQTFRSWPLIGLALFSEPALLTKAAHWRRAIEAASDAIVSDAKVAASKWRRSVERMQRSLEAFDSGLRLDVTVTGKVEALTEGLEELDPFFGGWLIREAEAGEDEVQRAGAAAMQRAVRDAQLELIEAQKHVEELKAWRKSLVDQILKNRDQTALHHRMRLGLRPDDDRAQAGCMMAGGVGCAGYALYFLGCMVSAAFAASAGPNTSAGKLVLSALAVPFVMGVLFTIVDGIRRVVAESELGRELRQLDAEGEKAIEEIDTSYRAKIEPLTEAVEKARIRRDQATEALRQLQELKREGEPEADAA